MKSPHYWMLIKYHVKSQYKSAKQSMKPLTIWFVPQNPHEK